MKEMVVIVRDLKQVYYTFTLLCGMFFLNSCAQPKSSPLLFEEQAFNFGSIQEENGKVSHSFVFRNMSNKPLVINQVVADCGCMSNEYTKDPVEPGGKGEVVVSYNPAYRPGDFYREITIFSNDNEQIDWLTVEGTVIPFEHPVEEDYPYGFGKGLYLHLKVLSFPRIAVGAFREIILGYANDTNEPMTLEFVIEGEQPNISFEDPGKLDAKERGQVVIKYTMKEAINEEEHTNIYPVVNGVKLEQPLLLRVTGSK